jgi:nitrogen-specific signal transduction histidine kinase
MTMSLTAQETLNREFLEIRCRILDLAAMLDRLERADDTVADDPRLKRIHEALDVLKKVHEDRAEQVQLTFSRPYDESWLQTLKVKPR